MLKLQLSIPEPCHENWQQMTPTDQGRFCNACAKEVIDFSTMTDMQVLNYFSNLTHEKVCGRALPDQLDRAISRPAEPKKRLFWYWNYFVMFFMFFTKGNNAKAQICTKPATEVNPVKNVELRGDVVVVAGQIRNDVRQYIISGKVIDEKGEPIPYASIIIKGKMVGVAADNKGKYTIKAQPNCILSISAANYKTAEIIIGNKKEIDVVLEKFSDFALGGVIVVQNYVDGVLQYPSSQNHVAAIVIKDWESSDAIAHAKIFIYKNYFNTSHIAFSDKNGKYKIKEINSKDRFSIKIEADGYEPNEFTIESSDFKDRKKEWKVLLRKQPVKLKNASVIVNNELATKIKEHVVVSQVTEMKANPLSTKGYMVTKTPAIATGLTGRVGGVSIRKIEKKPGNNLKLTVEDSALQKFSNTIKDKINLFIKTDSLKIYPNPVQRNNTFSVSLKLKQAGRCQIQITDVAGKLLLQKQIVASGKNHVEHMLAESSWSSGLYYIRVFDSNNTLISKNGFIVQ